MACMARVMSTRSASIRLTAGQCRRASGSPSSAAVLALEHRSARHQGVDDHAEAIQVAGEVDERRASIDLLGGEVGALRLLLVGQHGPV